MPKSPRRRTRRFILVLLVVLAAGWFLPAFFSAESYRQRLEKHLGDVLQRKVTFGSISLHLLPRPGFWLTNVSVGEDPQFGSEPFARIDQLECDLRLRSLLRARLEFSRLALEGATLTLVRGPDGEWNAAGFLGRDGARGAFSWSGQPATALDVDLEDSRLNFKVGPDLKPFAMTDLKAQLHFDRARGSLEYHLAGSPVRTDLMLPTPGVLELTGGWNTRDPLQPITARLQTRDALLYDWVPILSGRNPGLYGVVNASLELVGSPSLLNVQGQARLTQVRRWESLPPRADLPINLQLRGVWDRSARRARVEKLEASFGDSTVWLAGWVETTFRSPQGQLKVSLERARLEDLFALGRRFSGGAGVWAMSGAVEGTVSLEQTGSDRRVDGLLRATRARLGTPAGSFSVGPLSVTLNNSGAYLAPTTLTLAPRVELVAQGSLQGFEPSAPAARSRRHRAGGKKSDSGPAAFGDYQLSFSVRTIALRDAVGWARAAGVRSLQNVDAEGSASAAWTLTGGLWPFTAPQLAGRVVLGGARLRLPGLTVPIELIEARVQVAGDRVAVTPFVARMGSTTFSGELDHQGGGREPWKFDLQADRLSLSQSAQWLDVLRPSSALALLDWLPGVRSLAELQAARSGLFGALNAEGRLEAAELTYRSAAVQNARAVLAIRDRVIRVASVSFRAAGGRGQGSGLVDLTTSPARVTVDASLSGAHLETWVASLPPQLRRARGLASFTGHFEMRGLSHQELASSLTGQATLSLRNVDFGGFDPLEATARAASWGRLAPARADTVLRNAEAKLTVAGRKVTWKTSPAELSGARFEVSGVYHFQGAATLDIKADFNHVARRWAEADPSGAPGGFLTHVSLAGPLNHLALAPELRLARAKP